MFAAVIVLHILCSLALVAVVLLQAGKGSGIANVFGGAGQTVFGARTGDMLTRGTTVCAALFMITSLVLAMLSSDRSSSVMNKRPRPAPMAMPIPGQEGVGEEAVKKVKGAISGIAKTLKEAAEKAAQAPVAETTTGEEVASSPENPVPVESATTTSAPIGARGEVPAP